MNGSSRRVVISGVGLISPLGFSSESLWEALSSGKSGVTPVTRIPAEKSQFPCGGECSDFTGHIDDFGPLDKQRTRGIRKGIKLMCREIQMGVAAAQRALSNAGLEPGGYDPERTGVCFGSDYIMTTPEEYIDGIRDCMEEGQFEYSRWAEKGIPGVTPLWLLKFLPNMPASHIAIYNDLRGPSNSITLREAAANLSIAEGSTIVARGAADIVLAGATGTRLHPVRSVHVAIQEDLANTNGRPESLSRPFDRDRTGMVLGEGAGALVLETPESASSRGATILGEVVGTGSSAVLDRNGTGKLRAALANAMHMAIKQAGMKPEEVGHIHAHGLSTKQSDIEEAAAILDVFGATDQPPVVAAKSYFGHLGAGSGAVELIASLLALDKGNLFRMLNYDTPDPDCPIPAVVDDTTPAGNSVLSVNTTPQGQASALLVRRWEE